MSTRPYPSYKDSGVEWLGRIPAQWQVKRLKFAAPACDVKLAEKPSGSTYVGLENIEPKTGRLLLDAPVELVDSTVVAFRRGDVLFGKLRPYLAKVVRPDFDGVATTELLVLRPHDGLDAQFLTYRLLAPDSIELINASTYGAKMPRANGEQVGNLAIAWPSLQEQQVIAEFLDRETGKIDALVKKKERLIELLQEKRTALISHAVTQGLNPNAPKRDSGIPWLGHIPEHWQLKKIGFFASVGNGSTPERGNEDYWTGGDFPWLNSSVVNDENVTESPDFVTPVALRECHLPIVRPGSVLVAITGEGKTRGMAAVLRIEATINQHLAFIAPDSRLADGEFLRAALASRYQVLRFLSEGTGSTKGALTCEQLKQFKVPLPPLSEQRAIVEHIDRETAKLDALTAKVRSAIERLREYRTALISAAVTGQIDVRHCGGA